MDAQFGTLQGITVFLCVE